jgi:hypothetical protein
MRQPSESCQSRGRGFGLDAAFDLERMAILIKSFRSKVTAIVVAVSEDERWSRSTRHIVRQGWSQGKEAPHVVLAVRPY